MSAWHHDNLAMRHIGDATLVVVEADLTALDVAAVVNAANEQLAHGGGVARALAQAGGPAVQRESDEWVRRNGPLQPGHAAVTTAGKMPADHVIHVVGPRYRSGQDNAGLLRDAVRAALDAAAGSGARTVALPAISAGIFGYPAGEATTIITSASADWLSEHDDAMDAVVLVGYDRPSAELFVDALRSLPDDNQ